MVDLSKNTQQKLVRLLVWVHHPTTIDELKQILVRITTDELLQLVQCVTDGDATGQILWVEYANRRGFLKFTFEMVRMADGSAHLECVADARPVHSAILLGN